MQPSKRSYNTVRTSGGTLGGSYGWYYYYYYYYKNIVQSTTVQLRWWWRHCETHIHTYSVTTPSTSWLKSRKMKWVQFWMNEVQDYEIYTLKLKLLFSGNQLPNLHLWECSRFIKGNHSNQQTSSCSFCLWKTEIRSLSVFIANANTSK